MSNKNSPQWLKDIFEEDELSNEEAGQLLKAIYNQQKATTGNIQPNAADQFASKQRLLGALNNTGFFEQKTRAFLAAKHWLWTGGLTAFALVSISWIILPLQSPLQPYTSPNYYDYPQPRGIQTGADIELNRTEMDGLIKMLDSMAVPYQLYQSNHKWRLRLYITDKNQAAASLPLLKPFLREHEQWYVVELSTP